jgi:hypothetical protein
VSVPLTMWFIGTSARRLERCGKNFSNPWREGAQFLGGFGGAAFFGGGGAEATTTITPEAP